MPLARAQQPACDWCRATLQSVEALRQRLPAGWQAALEPEPALGGQMLVVRGGAAEAPLLLLVHGLGSSGFIDWWPVMPALARRWRVLAVDLPGFGYSTTPPGRLSPTRLAQALERLLEREAAGPVAVAGHSMGAAVALRLARRMPDRVSRLLLASAAGILHRTAFSKHLILGRLPSDGWSEPLAEPAARLRDLGHQLIERLFGMQPELTEWLRANDWLWSLVTRDRNTLNAAVALVDEDFGDAVRELRQPTHLVWGDADTVAPLRTGELLERRLANAQLHTLRGVGHVPMADARDEFLRLLEQGLSEAPRRRLPPATDGEPPADLRCVGEVGRRLQGRYRTLHIERCTAVQLVDVEAERIVLRDSIVRMTGGRVRAEDVALDVANSELVATACDLHGRTAIRCDAARLDLAGVDLLAQEFAVRVAGRSRLVASVCRVRDARYEGGWHDDRTLEQQLLDLRAPQPAGPAPGRA